MKNSIIFHIDVNSAYLSWTAASRLQMGEKIDLREIPSVIGGDTNSRQGIVLAKSIPAKKYKIETGEPLYKALEKCKNLKIIPPNYNLFMKCSNALFELVTEYTPQVQRFSVDECFLDMSHHVNDYMEKAFEIKERIYKELGFTVNIGISNNKLLAKMASDFKKPNNIHTLFPNEIKQKMWPLPVEDLFMVGRATTLKLNKLNIHTIKELALYDYEILQDTFKSFGKVLHNYANGIENSIVNPNGRVNIKGLGNSTTISYDVKDREEAHKILLSLTETTTLRLRKFKSLCGLVSVTIKNNDFFKYSHQQKLVVPTDSTKIIYENIKKDFDDCWRGDNIRSLGIRLSELSNNDFYQSSLLEDNNIEKYRNLDKAIDEIRLRYGNDSIIRSTFLHSGIKPLSGGNGEDDYLMMSSIL